MIMRKMKLTLFLILISITSFAQINPDFQTYYDSFLSDASSRSVSLDLSYSLNMKFVYHHRHSYLGISLLSNEIKNADILIKRDAWDAMTVTERKILIYHELGHVLLHRPHQDHNLSLMNSSAISETIYLNNENTLLDELFKPYASTASMFKSPIGNPLDPFMISNGDLILFSKAFGYPLEPFIVDFGDKNNKVHDLGGYQLYIVSLIDLNDSSKIVFNGKKIIQIRSINGGVSLVQTNPLYQPTWNSLAHKTEFPWNTYFEYHFDALNSTFDSTPFLLPDSQNYTSFSGQVKINSNMNKWTGKIIVLFYEKPYLENHE
jgi:hypothetical protein